MISTPRLGLALRARATALALLASRPRGRTLLAGAVAAIVLVATPPSAPAAAAKAPKRVVALTPYSANTMALLGVLPIAVGQVATGGPDVYAPALKNVQRLALSHPGGPNLEQLTKLRADFAFTSQAWSRGTAGMKRIGLRVANREPRRVTDVPRQTRRIGALIGRSAAGKRLAKAQERQIHAATKNIRKHPKVLLVLGVGSAPYAFLGNSWGGDVVKRAGGKLITGGLRASGGYARISDEAVVARNPDVIIAVPHGNPKDISKIASQLRSRPGWRTTKAARNKRVYISTSNTLLQPISSAGVTIAGVRRLLGN